MIKPKPNMNNSFKGLSATACKALIFSVLCIVSLTSVFAKVADKQNRGNSIVYAHKLQAVSDTTAVLQKCLDMPELQQYFPKNLDGTYKQVYVMQYPVAFSANNAVSKFQQSVSFEQRGAIYADKADGFFMFRSFSISGNTAAVTFDYNYNYTTVPAAVEVTLTLQKTGSTWAVTNTQLHNR
jgi:hypothetical protein